MAASEQAHRVELLPTRMWPKEAEAARFEHIDQGPAFAELTGGEWKREERVPAVWLRAVGKVRGRLTVGDWLVRRNGAFEVLGDVLYRERYEPAGTDVAPLDQMVNSLPEPTLFRQRILAAARERYALLVAEQGDVHDEADTWQAQRDLTQAREVAKLYASTFTAVAKEIGSFQQDQLERVPGTPERVVIPDADGDIIVAQDLYNEHTIDVTELQAAVCAVVLADGALDSVIDVVENADSEYSQREWLGGILAQMLIAAQAHLVSMGKFDPQVTKVREFAKQQARTGADGLAAVIAGTITTKRKARDQAKFSRKEAKS